MCLSRAFEGLGTRQGIRHTDLRNSSGAACSTRSRPEDRPASRTKLAPRRRSNLRLSRSEQKILFICHQVLQLAQARGLPYLRSHWMGYRLVFKALDGRSIDTRVYVFHAKLSSTESSIKSSSILKANTGPNPAEPI